jgi:hypothetical protein
MLWLDRYERRARLAPGLLALLPVAVTITALGLRDAPVVSAVVSLLSLAGGPVLLADTVRTFGTKAQEKLWKTWGGSPTTIALRMREPTRNGLQRDRWRSAVEKVADVKLATRRSEQSSPAKADEAIEVAVGRLRELTRGSDPRFLLVQAENRGYGFQRNLYGIRHVGRLLALGGALVMGAYIAWRGATGVHPVVLTADVLGLIANVLILLGWCVLPSASRVRAVGDKYAYQVLQAAVSLASDTPAAAVSEPVATDSDPSSGSVGAG